MKPVRPSGSRAVPAVVAAMVLTALLPDRVSAQDSFPSRPPAPAPLAPARFPPYRESTLPNGADLIVVEHHEQPVLSVSLSFRAGAALDPAGKEGLAAIAAELLTKGTPTRSAEQLAAAIEGAGGALSASAGADFLTVSVSVLAANADLAFTLLGDVVQRSTWPESELELARTRYLSALQLELSQPEAVAQRRFAAEIYGRHPYGRRTSAASYRAITRDDVVRFGRERLRPVGALLVVAGDVTLPQVQALIRTHFARWAGAPGAAPVAPAVPVKRATDILLVHRPGSVQASVVLGNTTMLPRDTGYYAARVATHVLGGGADARLFQILREQKSWTYGAYAQLERLRGLGHWQATAEVRTEVADSALAELLRQIERMRTEAVPAAELANAKGFLIGVFPLTIETPAQIARQVATGRLLGLGPEYLRLYRERLNAVTAARARAAAARTYRRQALTIVVVGDAERLYDRLATLAPVHLMNVDGQPMTPADLRPTAGMPVLDRSQIVSRTDSFRIMVQGNALGVQINAIRVTPDSLVYIERSNIGAFVQQQSTAVLDPADLSMRAMDQTGSAQGQKIEAHLIYGGGRVKGAVTQPQAGGTARSFTVDTTVAPGTYDDNALALVLAALPLEPGKTINLNVFASGEGVSRIFTVKVGGPESVTVPAGTFQAYRLDIAGGQAPLVIHVTTETPRRIVRFEPVGTPIVLELVK
ncbi:MAG: M16 family metallopeptidase [Gemmatimonadales bacterium]